MSRHAARERTLQTLFQMDINEMPPDRAVTYVDDIMGSDAHDVVYYRELLEGVLLHRKQLDVLLGEFSQEWDVDRMAGVDRNILRIGLYELLYQDDTPAPVVLDEAVELCKEYGTDRSSKFVNGVLAGLLRNIDALRAQAEGLS